MNMKSVKTILVIALTATLAIPGTGVLAQDTESLDALISKMPASNIAEEHKVDEQILESGQEALEYICEQIVPEGEGGVSARYALNSVAAYCSKDGRDAEREMLETVVGEAISNESNDEVRSFLVDQLRWIASDQSVPILGKLIKDKRLCSPACRVLITLDSDKAEKVLVEALPEIQGAQRICVIKALGRMQSDQAAKLIRQHAKAEESDLRDVSLYALAMIGQEEDADLLASPVETGTDYEKSQFADYNLIFARRLAESGKTAKSTQICRKLMQEGNEINTGVPCAALSTVVEIHGEKAFPTLLKAMETKNEFLQGTAAQLAEEFDGDEYIEEWGKMLPRVSDSAKLKIVKLLGETGNEAAIEPLRKMVGDSGKKISTAAIHALLKLAPERNAGFLIERIEDLNLSSERKLELLSRLAPYAETSAEKSDLIATLSNFHNLESLEMIARFIDDADASSEASLAAVEVAVPEKDKPLTAPAVADILFNAAQNIDNPQIREKAMAQVAEVKEMHDLEDAIPDKDEKGFVQLFNGKNFENWQGLMKKPYDNPYKRDQLSSEKREELQQEADQNMKEHWSVKDGVLVFDGKGRSLVTEKHYSNFEMFVDWKINSGGDSGLYLRGCPQVQIWDRDEGSGGLYNNKNHPSNPLEKADNPTGEWNTFYIKMVGDKVTVYLNGTLVVDEVPLENYWDRDKPLPASGPIELQAHGDKVWFKDIYVRELEAEKVELPEEEKEEGFELLFNGLDLEGWQGNKKAHVPENGVLKYDPKLGGGNLYTEEEYEDFIFRFEFKLTPGANNGLGIRTPLKGDPAYKGMEIQILDNTAEKYANLEPYQYHGSIYGIVPAELGRLRPVGQWNEQEVIVNGRDIKVILNGETIVDANLDEATKDGTMDGKKHPGLDREKGYICFCSHGSLVYLRNIRIKELP